MFEIHATHSTETGQFVICIQHICRYIQNSSGNLLTGETFAGSREQNNYRTVSNLVFAIKLVEQVLLNCAQHILRSTVLMFCCSLHIRVIIAPWWKLPLVKVYNDLLCVVDSTKWVLRSRLKEYNHAWMGHSWNG